MDGGRAGSSAFSSVAWGLSIVRPAMTSALSRRPRAPRLAAFALAAFALAAPACASSIHEVTGKASQDLQCPVSQLTVTDVDGRTRRVQGCGKEAVFVEDCTAAPPCRWRNRDKAPGQ